VYKSRRRPWVKLYCREWLTSTVRFDLTEEDRSRFIDLLALAGDSKFPGVVCPGRDGEGDKVGYPLDWLASTMRCKIPELLKSLEKLVKSDRISMKGPKDAPVISITSWKRYQSEYLRQIESLRKNRNLQTSSQKDVRTPATSTQLRKTEGEVEGEGEREGDKEAEAEPPQYGPAAVSTAFAFIHGAKPYGSSTFQEIVTDEFQNHDKHVPKENWSDTMERVIQRCQSLKVVVPGRFYTQKRAVEKAELTG
jgi:hypothetical protein